MKILTLAAALAATSIPAAVQAQVAVANLEGAVQQSAAFQAASAQMRVTYKAQIDAFTARQNALNTELQPLVTAFQAAQQRPGATEASLKPQYDVIQAKRTAIQRELAPLYQPIARTQGYVEEQIVAKLDAATKAAMAKRRVTTLLRPDAAFVVDPSADLTPAIVTELNALVPTASITVPAGWQPGQANAARAATVGAAQQPVPPKPVGR